MGDKGRSHEDAQDLGLCHRMILVPFMKTGTLTDKGLGRKTEFSFGQVEFV